jgi:hypothetical protein
VRQWKKLAEESRLHSLERRLAAHERRVKRKLWMSLALAIFALVVITVAILLIVWFVK